MKSADSRIGVRDGRKGRFWADNDIFAEPISGDAKLVYLFLCRSADRHGVCYPSRDTISRSVGKSVRQIGRCLSELVVRGLLEVKSNAAENGANLYTVIEVGHTVLSTQDQVGHTCLSTQEQKATQSFQRGPHSPTKEVVLETTKGRRADGIVLTDDAFIAALKSNPAYEGIDVDRELAKLDAWLMTPRGHGKHKTRQRIVNWLNRAERIVGPSPPVAAPASPPGMLAL